MRGVTMSLLLYMTSLSTTAGITVSKDGLYSATITGVSGPVYYARCTGACSYLAFTQSVITFDVRCAVEGYRDSVGCPSREELRMTCDNEADALAKWSKMFVGRQYTGVPKLQSTGQGQMHCPASDGVGAYYNNAHGGGVVPPIQCSVGPVDLTLSGPVGSVLSAVEGVSVQCDSVVDIRLTIDGGGRVELPGGGGVVLTFLENGADVLTTTSDHSSILISAALAKPPAGAGTYRGSAVLRLDIL
jgi:hypothetical protein